MQRGLRAWTSSGPAPTSPSCRGGSSRARCRRSAARSAAISWPSGSRRLSATRALVAGQDRPPQAVVVVSQPAPVAHRVAVARRLDLDHVGAEVAQQRAGERAGEQLPELDRAQSVQWFGHVSSRNPTAPRMCMRITASASCASRARNARDEPAVAQQRLRALRLRVPEDAAERARDPGRGAHRDGQPRAPRRLDDDAVEVLVVGDLVVDGRVLGASQSVCRRAMSSSAIRRAPRARRPRGSSSARTLVEVEQVVAVEGADDRAAVGLDLDQALRLELQQRLADRRARRPEALRERLRPQPLTRLQDPFEDRLLQQVAHADGARLGHLAYEITRFAPAQGRAGGNCMQSAHGAPRPRRRPRLVLRLRLGLLRRRVRPRPSRVGGGCSFQPGPSWSSGARAPTPASAPRTGAATATGTGVACRRSMRASRTAASSEHEQDQRDQDVDAGRPGRLVSETPATPPPPLGIARGPAARRVPPALGASSCSADCRRRPPLPPSNASPAPRASIAAAIVPSARWRRSRDRARAGGAQPPLLGERAEPAAAPCARAARRGGPRCRAGGRRCRGVRGGPAPMPARSVSTRRCPVREVVEAAAGLRDRLAQLALALSLGALGALRSWSAPSSGRTKRARAERLAAAGGGRRGAAGRRRRARRRTRKTTPPEPTAAGDGRAGPPDDEEPPASRWSAASTPTARRRRRATAAATTGRRRHGRHRRHRHLRQRDVRRPDVGTGGSWTVGTGGTCTVGTGGTSTVGTGGSCANAGAAIPIAAAPATIMPRILNSSG